MISGCHCKHVLCPDNTVSCSPQPPKRGVLVRIDNLRNISTASWLSFSIEPSLNAHAQLSNGTLCLVIGLNFHLQCTVKPVKNSFLKIDKTKVLMTNGTVKSV